jgi:putative addiction module component (TIGR02574 family)
MSAIEQVFSEALSLPAKERASLAQRLLASLDETADSPEIEAAWKQEALDRCAAFDGGQMAERDAADVLREAYRKTT